MRAFEQVRRDDGGCDALVNCAGIAKVFPSIDFALDNFVATMNVHFSGTLPCTQSAARPMPRRRGPRIVHIALLFLVWSRSVHATGTVLDVSGGLHIH